MKFINGLKTQRPSSSFTKSLSVGLLFCVLLIVPTIAHADSYATYNLGGTFNSGGSLSGSFTLDTTSGIITTAGVVADGITFLCPGGASNTCILYNTLDQTGNQDGFLIGVAGQALVLDWAPNSNSASFPLDTYAYGVINGSYCIGCISGGNDFLASGTATDPPPDGSVPTPEPNAALLLLSGLTGIGILGFRRSAFGKS
jgi:hypothetical protein